MQKEGGIEMSDSVAEFLARGGKIYQAAPGESCGVPIIPSKSPDGIVRNDYHQQDRSRKRPREKNKSIVIFPQPKKKVGASGHMYVRCKEINGVMHYKALIRDVSKSEWVTDMQIAMDARNMSLTASGEEIPD